MEGRAAEHPFHRLRASRSRISRAIIWIQVRTRWRRRATLSKEAQAKEVGSRRQHRGPREWFSFLAPHVWRARAARHSAFCKTVRTQVSANSQAARHRFGPLDCGALPKEIS